MYPALKKGKKLKNKNKDIKRIWLQNWFLGFQANVLVTRYHANTNFFE